MSKYIKLEDAEKLLTNALRIAQGFDEPLERSLVDLPTIEFNKEGEWYNKEIWKNNDKGRVVPVEEWQSATCSVCGRYHTTPYAYYFDDFNYCPNCGAKMKG